MTTTLSVNVTTDQNDGSTSNGLSLREAIMMANANPNEDYIIELQGGQTYNLTITGGLFDESQATNDLDITTGANITIKGIGGEKAIINGAGIINGTFREIRMFQIFDQASLTLDNITITEGKDGAIQVEDGGFLSVKNSEFKNNSSATFFSLSDAATIANFGTTIIDNSLFTNNTSGTGDDGIISNQGDLEIHNSEITFNTAGFTAGAVYNDNGTVMITNTTMSNNEAEFYGGAIYNNDEGIFTVVDSIIEDNEAGFGGAGISNRGTINLVNTSVTGNKIERTISVNINGSIENNGVLNISQNSQITNSIGNGILNKGEVNISDSVISNNSYDGLLNEGLSANIVNSTFSNNDDTGIRNSSSTLKIRDSVVRENTSSGIINSNGFAEVINNTIQNNQGNGISNSGNVVLDDTTNLYILQTLIDGNTFSGLFNNEGTVEISDSIIQNHHETGDGGGIDNQNGVVILNDSIVQNNSATGNGGGIFSGGFAASVSGKIELNGSIIRNNEAEDGGGIYNNTGILTINESLISNNQASEIGGGILYFTPLSPDSEFKLWNSTINGNQATFAGGIFQDGYVYNTGVGTIQVRSKASISNTTISNNSSTSTGGGMYNGNLGDVVLNNVTVTNNTADSDNNGVGDAGGIYIQEGSTDPLRSLAVGTVESKNSIIAGNFDSPNNAGTGNIYPDISVGESVGNNNNLIGSLAGIKGTLGTGTDIITNNPLLGPLQNNGGNNLPTHDLLNDSPAIDGGNNNLIPPDSQDSDGDGNTNETVPFDQRGGNRIVGGVVDIGAVEKTNNNLLINSAPVDITLGNNIVAQDQPIGTIIGNFNTTDNNAGDTFTYTLVDGVGDTDNDRFSIQNNQLKTQQVFEYGFNPYYSIRVQSTDQGGLSDTKIFTIAITDEAITNLPPTDINLDNNTVAENSAIGTTVGNLSTIDPDADNTFTYELVAGNGSNDNDLFAIDNNQLKTNAIFDYETKNSYNVRVRTTDQGGLFYEESLTINIEDVAETEVNFDIDGDGQYLAAVDGLLFYGYLNIRNLPEFLRDNLTQQLADNLIAPDSGATRKTGNAIASYLEDNIILMDIDGDGEISAAIDGLLAYGYFNIRNLPDFLRDSLTQQLADNLIPPDSSATRITGDAISAFMESYIV